MKLWLLRPVGYDGADYDEADIDPLWNPWYDKTFGFVVRAETEDEARQLAQGEAGDEARESLNGTPAWTSAEHSTCIELTVDGPTEIVIVDNHAA